MRNDSSKRLASLIGDNKSIIFSLAVGTTKWLTFQEFLL